MLRKIFSPLLVVFIAFASLAACGAPTVQSQIDRYKRAVDQLDILASKMPQHKFDIERKKAEFNVEFETLKSKTGDEAARALAGLCSRVEQFEQALNPQAVAAPAGSTTPGGKLGGPTDPAQPGYGGQPAQPAAGGKLGGAATPPAPAPQPAAGGSGFGAGGTGGAVNPTPAPAPQPATGGSGFGAGGTAPAPAPAPAPQPQGGSGFGGQ